MPLSPDQIARLGTLKHFPDLSFHYGLGFFELSEMPNLFIQLYVDAIPRLMAEQELLMMEASAYPHLKERQANNLHREILKIARANEPEPVKKISDDGDIAAAQLANVGIGMVFYDEDGNEVTPDA